MQKIKRMCNGHLQEGVPVMVQLIGSTWKWSDSCIRCGKSWREFLKNRCVGKQKKGVYDENMGTVLQDRERQGQVL